MNKALLIVFIVATVTCFNVFSSPCKKLKVGDKAPEFSLVDETGNVINLTDLKGKKVALYFFPKVHSLSFGCIEQACSIRNNFSDLTDYGITVLGLSKSSKKDRKKFITTNKLPFSLLDANRDTLKAYGVRGGFFRLYLPKRRTFLINEDGIIVAIISTIDVKNHAQQIIDGFETAKPC